MLEHAPDLSRLDPAGGELGQFVFGEEGDSLVSKLGRGSPPVISHRKNIL
jgi:hypothetical protein